jgi:polyribonucleotide nucleotidyltransferase
MAEVKMMIGGRELVMECGKYAKQAGGGVTVRFGDTMVLVAACISGKPREGLDFFPLMVNYRERTYAAGKIPGGFFKREGRPADKETISSRLIDRSIRPFFPDGLRNDVMVDVLVLAADKENDPDIAALIGTSLALRISAIPFEHTIGAARIGKIDGEFVVNPTFQQLENSSLDLVAAGTKDSIVMLEGGSKEVSEEDIGEALRLAGEEISKVVDSQEELIKQCGKEKIQLAIRPRDEELAGKVKQLAEAGLREACTNPDKLGRDKAVSEAKDKVRTELGELTAEQAKDVSKFLEEIEVGIVRGRILQDGVRPDGRAVDEVRAISCEVGGIPRVHGSAVFTRGQTQALAVTTLGSMDDVRRIELLEGETEKRFMLHYNFPSFSVGETRPDRGPSRRDIGHGMLAEKALSALIPSEEEFHYVVRLVSEILESNGSSSMASVCAGSLALMDAGIPIKNQAAGISVGLIHEDGKNVLLTDIQGLEDHYGDMDLKVAGTKDGITAVQMDMKVHGAELSLLKQALEQARVARLQILEKMNATLDKPREDFSEHAPRVSEVRINREKIGMLIGPGGKNIRRIEAETGADVSVNDDGMVLIYAVDKAASEQAVAEVKKVTAEVEPGKLYKGLVRSIKPFGAFVEVLPGQDGLVHISELSTNRVEKVEDVVNEGDEVVVKVVSVDRDGKIKLTMKDVKAVQVDDA